MKSLIKNDRLVISLLVLYVSVMIPINIAGQGYLPIDDALRHSAKVVSEKNWDEIIVIRDYIKIDSHIGWHYILGTAKNLFNVKMRSLAMFSVVFFFVLFSLIPIIYLKRPEAWIMALLAFSSLDWLPFSRLFLGRPCIATMSWILLLSFSWKELSLPKTPLSTYFVLFAYTTVVVFVQSAWPILGIPVIGFLFAKEYRAAAKLTAIIGGSLLAGAALTGHAVAFITQNFHHVYSALFEVPKSIAVNELQGYNGAPLIIFLVVSIILYKLIRNEFHFEILHNPVFIISLLSYIFQFQSARIWTDIGFPALCVWLSTEFIDICKNLQLTAQKRLILAVVVILTFYLQTTNDYQERWSKGRKYHLLSYNTPSEQVWLPEPGGIIYNSHMDIFFKGFYSNPNADWKYILGFEPAWMKKEDLEVYAAMVTTKNIKSMKPWIEKMTPKDRLVLRYHARGEPALPQLEWRHMSDGLWIGKKLNCQGHIISPAKTVKNRDKELCPAPQ